MHLEFVDLLRCPRPHDESGLVAAITRMEGRDVREGKLGCPVCGAEYHIRESVAIFSDYPPKTVAGDLALTDLDAAATTIAAFLDLTRPAMLVLLAGNWALASEQVAELTGARIVALDASPNYARSESVASVRADVRLPLANCSLDGIALDEAHSTRETLNDAARLLRPRARIVAAAAAELSSHFRDLARDSSHVVAEYVGELVSLRR